MAGAGDGHVTETGTEQVGMHAGVGVDEDALGGQALGTVAGDRIAVVEMAVVGRIELDATLIVQAGRDSAVG
jgi:hypothetical protein